MAQQQQSPFTVINNFFKSAPPEPVKTPVATLQKRDGDRGGAGVQERTEDEVTRLERKIAQQQKQLATLKQQVVASRGTNQGLLSQYRTLDESVQRNTQLCDNLRRQCNQLDEAKTVGRTARLMEDLNSEKKQALQGVSLASVERTTVDSRVTDRQMDKLFGRLTGTNHRDEDEEAEANDELYERLMQEMQQPSPVTNRDNAVPTNTNTTTTATRNNRAFDDILKF